MAIDLHLVTVLFNSPEVLPGFFESLSRQQDIPFVLHVVDNSTNDDSQSAIRRLASQYDGIELRYTKNPTNVGVAAGNNLGIRAALAESAGHVLLINNDIEFADEHLFSRMLAAAVAGDHPLLVPKIFFYDADWIWCAGGSINPLTAVTRHFGERNPDGPEFSLDKPVSYAPTCVMLIETQVFGKIGLMDEGYFVYYDDTDFVWRCGASGIPLFYWSKGSIRHKVSTSTGGADSAFTRYYATRNRIYFIRKNFGVWQRSVALSYFFITRLFKRDLWSSERRKVLRRAVKDGFSMQIFSAIGRPR